jgi:NADH dehydrogenase
MPVIPAFIPAPKVQPIHVDDCVLGLLKLAYNSNVSSNIYRLGAKTPVPFTEFLGAIAKHRLRVRRFYLPVPVAFVRLFSKLLGVSKGPVSSLRRLESLFELPPMDTEADLCAIGLTLRSLHSGMHRSGSNRRRKLIREANCLLMYLLKERPGKSLIRRYVRMVETLHQGVPLGLSSWQYRWPAFLTLIDCPRFKRAVSGLEFGWRLDAAMLIAEASPQGAVRFLGSRESTNKYSSLVGIVTPLFYELLWRVLRALWPIRFPDQSKADQQDV